MERPEDLAARAGSASLQSWGCHASGMPFFLEYESGGKVHGRIAVTSASIEEPIRRAVILPAA